MKERSSGPGGIHGRQSSHEERPGKETLALIAMLIPIAVQWKVFHTFILNTHIHGHTLKNTKMYTQPHLDMKNVEERYYEVLTHNIHSSVAQ